MTGNSCFTYQCALLRSLENSTFTFLSLLCEGLHLEIYEKRALYTILLLGLLPRYNGTLPTIPWDNSSRSYFICFPTYFDFNVKRYYATRVINPITLQQSYL